MHEPGLAGNEIAVIFVQSRGESIFQRVSNHVFGKAVPETGTQFPSWTLEWSEPCVSVEFKDGRVCDKSWVKEQFHF